MTCLELAATRLVLPVMTWPRSSLVFLALLCHDPPVLACLRSRLPLALPCHDLLGASCTTLADPCHVLPGDLSSIRLWRAFNACNMSGTYLLLAVLAVMTCLLLIFSQGADLAEKLS